MNGEVPCSKVFRRNIGLQPGKTCRSSGPAMTAFVVSSSAWRWRLDYAKPARKAGSFYLLAGEEGPIPSPFQDALCPSFSMRYGIEVAVF
jgi:hypothetical protein